MVSRSLLPVLAAVAAAGACQDAPQVAPSGETGVSVTTVAKGLEHPWSLAFLPDGRMLVTERPGRLRYVTREGALSEPIAGVPAVYAEGQGGLLDVVLDPAFAENATIYLSYAEPGGRRHERHGGRPCPPRGQARSPTSRSSSASSRSSRATTTSARGWCSRATATFSSPPASATRSATRRRTSAPTSARSCASRRTAACRRTIRSSAATAHCRRSGRTATATCKARPCTLKPASSGRTSMARAAATRSTSRARAGTTAGR